MTIQRLRVLVVEDSESDAKLLVHALRKQVSIVETERVEDADAMREALRSKTFDLITSDWSMPHFSAPAALAVATESGLDLPFIIVSGTIGEETAVEAMRGGAHDYLIKGNLTRLLPAIERELREAQGRSARRRAEEELGKVAQRYKDLFESSPLPTLVYDTRSLEFLAVNEAAVLHYGYTRGEFSKLSFAHLQDPQRPERDTADTDRGAGAPIRHRKKDGILALVETKAHDFELDGRPARLLLVNDITERKLVEAALRKSEEERRQAQKLEAIGSLAGGIAHDFNNLLSVILGYTGLALAELKPGEPVRDDIVEVELAGKRAAALTRQLLAFSRKQILQVAVLDLNELVRGIEKMLERLIGEDLTLSVFTARDLGKIHADPSQVEQIVMNLVVNARDAMPNGGALKIETLNVLLDARDSQEHNDLAEGSYVKLIVADTGSGMDAATQARMFEPFFTTKGKDKGTGLGLSTVFGIVKQSGGHIAVHSELGRGTTFEIYFPRNDLLTDTADAKPAIVVLTGTETVLLVEDERQVRELARAILHRNGYKVLEASSGGDALLVCEQHAGRIDLLITDVVMPRMSGKQLVERLAPLRPEMKVLYMSGYTDGAIVQHDVLDSELKFLQKPIIQETLLRKVRQALQAGSVK